MRSRKFPHLEDEAWLRARYVEERLRLKDIAAQVGCSESTVHLALRRCGIESSKDGRPRAFPKLDDPAWLRLVYVDGKRTGREIAAMIGCQPTAVHDALRRHGIDLPPGGRRAVRKLRDKAWLEEQYLGRQMSCVAIAKEIGCSTHAVSSALKRHEIKTRTHVAGIRLALTERERLTKLGKVEAARREKAKVDTGGVGKTYTNVIRELQRLDRAPRTDSRDRNALVNTAMAKLHEAEQALGLWLDLA